MRPNRVRLSRTVARKSWTSWVTTPRPLPQRIEARRLQIDPSDPHGPGVGVVEASDQPGDRGLAATGAPQQPEDRAGLQPKADVIEDDSILVGERDLVELDR